ncbi:ABC transporter substrate-binding protein [Spirillospora sp. CA-294931]|uniref:ABC transporter substrate-binding protein n=1 Tax=Spirillospora sp. CA-294931 TaxID=3240042 RepID=UPI003D9493B6
MTRPEITPLRAGDPGHLGPYRLTGLLGEGGQGSVFLGEDEAERRVAVKLLHARFSGDAKARARFAAEVAVAQRVSPFCTARILDSDVQGDRPYIVSEYIEGPSLAEVLAGEGPREGPELDRLAIGTMTALAAIHQAGVVHRDFKPGNVLLADDGPRVIDFGIARALDATGTLSSTAVGTPAYMAPEQISGAAVGPAADVWAWAATMAYAATGKPAFGSDTIPAVMHRILNLPPELGTMAEPLRGLVAYCLNKDAAHRPSSHQVLVHLLSLAGSLPGSAGGAAAAGAEVLNQGAAAASTTELRLAAPPPAPRRDPAPVPQPDPRLAATNPPPTPWAPAAHHAGPANQGWQNAPTGPVGGPRKPGKRGIGLLVGGGSAALVVLIMIGTAIAFNATGDGKPTTRSSPTGRTGGQMSLALNTFDDTTGISSSDAGYGTKRLLAKHLFTGLTEIDKSGTVRNRLATSLTADLGCTRWTVKLKTGTEFSNGQPVRAASFVDGWNRAAQVPAGSAQLLLNTVKGYPDVESGRAPALAGLKVVDDSTFSVDLTKPNCEFDKIAADPVLAPVPPDAGKHNNLAYNNHPIGNGPFKVTKYAKGNAVLLERNDAWALGKAKLDKVNVHLVDDPARARAGFDGKEFDWTVLTSASAASAQGSRGLTSKPSHTMTYLLPLVARGPMKSKEGRLAVSYALDRRAISSRVNGGLSPVASGIVPSTIAGFAPDSRCAPCQGPDPAKAKQLAAQAGLKAGTVVRLYLRNSPSTLPLGELVKQQLADNLGWKVEVKLVEVKDFTQTITAKDAEGLVTLGWLPDYPSAHNLLYSLLGGEQAATRENNLTNYSGWRNARFDELLAQAAKTSDAAARAKLLRDAEGVALGEMAMIPVINGVAAVRRSDRFVGLTQDYDGDPTLATAALK